MPNKIIVAFKTRVIDGFVPDTTGYSAPANYKDEAKIAEWFDKKKIELTNVAALQPYTSTFDMVSLSDVASGRQIDFAYRPPEAKKQPACMAIKAFLLKQYPHAWPNSTHPQRGLGGPPVIFLGFNPKLFLKILGIECSLPQNQVDSAKPDPLPLSMWYGNSDHRDIEEAVMPSDYAKTLTWSQVLTARGLAKKYEKWTGPHVDVKQDLALATDLAAQLGLLSDE